MISFRLDGRSVVPPYLQIVQQVRQALRMGVLDVGDQLPTVREVVAATAINPNTVLKAYRDLERDGLVEPRAGHERSCGAGRPARRRARMRGWPAAWPSGCTARARPGLMTSRSNRCCTSRCGRRPRRGLLTTRQDLAPPAIETRGLSKRYRKVTALSEATISVPEGRISALIGPNGAGKSTLLRLLAGLARPSGGELAVLSGSPRQDPAFLAEVGFLAQEIPLYRRFTATDHIRIGAHLNPRWDAASARQRLRSLSIPLDQAVGTLSGGQRAQVALALTLAKQPRLLLLDEPVAALDPLARRNFLACLAEAVIDGGLTVVLSSHLLADLERVCDHLILLATARVQLCGDIDTLLAEHQVLVGPRQDTTAIERNHEIVQAVRTVRQTTLLIRRNGPVIDPAWQAADVGLEELVLGYMGRGTGAGLDRLTMVGEDK